MPKRLFIGGPWDGRVENLPEHVWNWSVQLPHGEGDTISQSTIVYHAVRFGPESCRTMVMTCGDPTQEQIFCALLKAAGVDR